MAKRPNVPKFGNWENEGNALYTTYFNEARKGKAGGKMINPNDPQENPEMFADQTPLPPAPAARPNTPPDEPVHKRSVPPTPDRQVSREEEQPANNENQSRKNSGGAVHHRAGHGAATGRPVRHSVGSDHSFDRSPLHPHYQAKVTGGKGGGSPAWEGKNSYDASHGTPGRSRMKPTRVSSPDNGAVVPRFGEWDNNPSSGENYTHVFNKVREERVTGSPMVSSSDVRPNYNIPRNRKPEDDDKPCCCFPWSK